MNRRSLAIAMAGAITVGVSGYAVGGLKQNNISVSFFSIPGTSNTGAQGQLGAARASADGNQAIGCWVRQYVGQTLEVQCKAIDSAGTVRACASSSTALRDIVQTISGDSWISFAVNPSGACVYIAVENSSAFPPKQF